MGFISEGLSVEEEEEEVLGGRGWGGRGGEVKKGSQEELASTLGREAE